MYLNTEEVRLIYMKLIDLEKVDYSAKTENRSRKNHKHDIFSVIHTSGSTGEPKLSCLTHENGINYIMFRRKTFEMVKQTISATIITFDAFFYETLTSLCNETPIILLNEEQVMNPRSFSEKVCAYNGSFLFSTPTKLRGYINHLSPPSFMKHIDFFSLGGEVLPEELLDSIHKNSSAKVCNIYGPTETTVNVSEIQL